MQINHENSLLVKRFSTVCIAALLRRIRRLFDLKITQMLPAVGKERNYYIVLTNIDSQYHTKTGITQSDQNIFNQVITDDIAA